MTEDTETRLPATTGAPAAGPGRGDPRVVYVQRPVKQVPMEQAGSGNGLLGSICGILLLVLAVPVCFGFIGQRLGFEATLGLIPTDRSLLDSMVVGIGMIEQVPRTILLSGSVLVLLPVLGLLMLAFPLAFAALARPGVPGGPPPRAGARFLAVAAGTLGGLIGGLSFISLFLPVRTEVLSGLPSDLGLYAGAWRPRLDVACSIDVFALLMTTLWMIVLFRLPLRGLGWTWLRVTMVFLVLCLFTGASRSIGLQHGLVAERPVLGGTGGSTTLLIGDREDSQVVYVVTAGEPSVSALVGAGTAGSELTSTTTGSIDVAIARAHP